MRKIPSFVITAGLVLAAAAPAPAQGRGRVRLSKPSSPTTPGQNSLLDALRTGGIGTIGRSGGNAGILRSTIQNRPQFQVRPSRPTPLPGGNTQPPPPAAGRVIHRRDEPETLVPPVRRPPRSSANATLRPLWERYQPTWIGSEYFEAIVNDAQRVLSVPSQRITSLVPDADGAYRRHMLAGEQALREGRFHDARLSYRLANDLADDPESYLGLTHTAFASSSGSYAMAAVYLRRGLQYLPELPMLPLRPRAMHGDAFAEAYGRLQDHLSSPVERGDHEALLLRAYYRWFTTPADDLIDQRAAREDLLRARAALDGTSGRTANEAREAIDTFLDGIDASGILAEPEPTGPPAEGAEDAENNIGPAAPVSTPAGKS